MHTAKGWVVSLFRNVEFGPTGPSWRRGEVGHVYHQRIVSNLAIAGETAWAAGSRARSVSFRVGPDSDFLWPRDRAREIADISVDTIPQRTILAMDVRGGKVSLDLVLQSDSLREKWTPTTSWLRLHLDEGAEPDECLDRVGYLVSLFSLLSWRDLHIEEMTIRHTDASSDTFAHRILLMRPERSSGQRSGNPIPISVDNEEEREAFRTVLGVWLARQNQWDETTGLMLAGLRRFSSVSAERALDACRWYEVIERVAPGDRNDERPAKMDEVVEAAVAKAKECNLEGYQRWIKERLSGVRGEPRRMRISRLAKAINEWFGDDLFDETGVEMIMEAYAARHKTGHGTLGPMGEPDVRRLWGNIVAMETFCALRTIADLPLSDGGLKWLRMHPLIQALKQLRKERISGEEGKEADARDLWDQVMAE
ncbi:MAG: hypothetical protein E5Y88_13565 [Mesorhizobium sp.]|uniref:hypothetical protein n=1 Tax=Mesorhizobium sp. TaxID=1871066 RepID=UPI000FE69B36|nr:hypothetical protein [Mesorhizobium sp.]RWQ38633.1 MAG: hypothetical protein EOS20_08370 [Mesorhizobium sp.]TIL25273.1 MAG: hypothetical protein E5Y88_13565 [Mesorhizobium sp.]